MEYSNKLPVPGLFLDLEALENNINWVINNSGNKSIRLASKSIRSRAILEMLLAKSSVLQGIMTYSLDEALWLRGKGLKNILMGYPSMDKKLILELAQNPDEITLMVDRPEHLKLIEACAKSTGNKLKVCVDIDLSLDLPKIRFGVYRSAIRNKVDLEIFLNSLGACSHVELIGLMGYEAQIAGVMDKSTAFIRSLKKISLPLLRKKRKEMVEMIFERGHELKIINGGGTGSLLETVKENVVTEITIGSAFYAPVLFDHYQDFSLSPALFFTQPIVRNPAPGVFTMMGGGRIASGELSQIKQPQVWKPEGLKPIPHEGFGEVQTPLKANVNVNIKIGDPIYLRHAKAGEICEHFEKIHLLKNGDISEIVKTYRGENQCFL
jgi:D-serine deaminase-like pyridoxal phosphate-dependent protein